MSSMSKQRKVFKIRPLIPHVHVTFQFSSQSTHTYVCVYIHIHLRKLFS